ncbi:Fatty acyl-CoA reductase 2 [Eumeta japonica]|uniref:Fatty acyl-CoA reductase n=1 Tax=Eumeta variegata TaxID=151549 RepID=A0A4C1Z7V6_EUMVA|nr:Fatty acyl-CoA reductase 2 [Eumeta japonica]
MEVQYGEDIGNDNDKGGTSCQGINRVYLLLRCKKGKDVTQRLQEQLADTNQHKPAVVFETTVAAESEDITQKAGEHGSGRSHSGTETARKECNDEAMNAKPVNGNVIAPLVLFQLFLGFTSDAKLRWNSHITRLAKWLSSAAYALKNTRLQQQVIRAVYDLRLKASLREKSKEINILTLAPQYIYENLVLLFAAECKHLSAFMHVSTAYSNAPRSGCKEEFYPSPIASDLMIEMAETVDEDILERITPGLIGDWPNTYTFSKALAEDQLKRLAVEYKVPATVIRPAIGTKEEKKGQVLVQRIFAMKKVLKCYSIHRRVAAYVRPLLRDPRRRFWFTGGGRYPRTIPQKV